MGYGLNRLEEPVFIAGLKPLLTESGLVFIIDWRVVGNNDDVRKNDLHLTNDLSLF